MARKSTTPPVQPVLPSNEPSPAVTFTPEKLAELINTVTEQRKMIADLLQLKASTGEAAKPVKAANGKAKPGPTMSIAGKSERSIKTEIETVRAFHKAGFKNAVPHENIKTFNRWLSEGRRVIEGSKSIKVANLRLFHVTQTREITLEEREASVAQQKAAIDRHTAKAAPKASPKGGKGNVLHLPQ